MLKADAKRLANAKLHLADAVLKAEEIADLRPQRRIDARNRGGACEVEMDQRIRAERLDQLDRHRNAVGRIRGSGGLGRRLRAVRGPDH